MLNTIQNTATSNDKFRRSTLSQYTPGPALYLSPEIKQLGGSIRDMIITKAHNLQEFQPHDHTHERLTFNFHGTEYYFSIHLGEFQRITIGEYYDNKASQIIPSY